MEGFRSESNPPESGGGFAGEDGFSYRRLLTGDDWARWDPFPVVGEQINVPTNRTDDLSVFSDDSTFPADLTGPEFLRWLTNANLTPQLPDLPLEEELRASPVSYRRIDGSEQEHEEADDTVSTNKCKREIIETILRSLGLRRYHSSEADPQCVICLEEIGEGEEAGRVRCGHEFHLECIKKWLLRKNCCPLCKTNAWDDVLKPQQ